MSFLNRNIVCLSAVMAMTLVCSACGGNKESHKAENSPHSEDSSNPGRGNGGGGGGPSSGSSSGDLGSQQERENVSDANGGSRVVDSQDRAMLEGFGYSPSGINAVIADHLAREANRRDGYPAALSDINKLFISAHEGFSSIISFDLEAFDNLVPLLNSVDSRESVIGHGTSEAKSDLVSLDDGDRLDDEAPAPVLLPYLSKKWELKEARCEGDKQVKKDVESMMTFFNKSKNGSEGIYLSFNTEEKTSKVEARRGDNYYRTVGHKTLYWGVAEDGIEFMSFEKPETSKNITIAGKLSASWNSRKVAPVEAFKRLFAIETGVQYQVRYDNLMDPRELVLSNPASDACRGEQVTLTFANVE